MRQMTNVMETLFRFGEEVITLPGRLHDGNPKHRDDDFGIEISSPC